MLNKGANQLEIARRAGVSRATVAFTFNDRLRCRVNVDTRNRVFQIARQLGYRPHRYAQVMRKGRSGVIGMIQSGSFVETLVHRSLCAAKAIHESGYQFLVGDVSCYSEGMRTACDAMLDARVEGVLLAGTGSDSSQKEIQRIQKAGIPLVALGGDRLPGVLQVVADVRQGMRELTRHLIGLGHRRLALAVPALVVHRNPDRNRVFSERVAGFQAAVSEEGITEAEVVYQPSLLTVDELYESGRLAARRVLTRDRRPEALLCSNDYWAVGAFKACADAGVRVPQDLAITGFDDTRAGEYTAAALTTVAQPSEAMAQTAVDLLVSMVRGVKPSSGEELVKVPCRLVVRESCGASLRKTRE